MSVRLWKAKISVTENSIKDTEKLKHRLKVIYRKFRFHTKT
jgi:hypothetical protein